MRVELGDHIRLTEPLKVRCCWSTVPVGDEIEIVRRTSDQPCKVMRTVFILHGTHGHIARTKKIHGEKV